MPAPTNLSFETAGVGGLPASWAITVQQSPEEIGVFAGDEPYETFESGWLSNEDDLFVFDVGDITAASFTTLATVPRFFDGFEELWGSNEQDLFVLEGPPAATFLGQKLAAIDGASLPTPIPDNDVGGATSQAIVGTDPGVSRIFVFVDITHQRRADLIVTLIDPDASNSVGNVWNLQNGGGNLVVEVEVTADLGPSPTIVGTWSLVAEDTIAANSGTFNAWQLRFYGADVGYDSFDENWSANETSFYTFDEGSFTTGLFNAGVDAVDTFATGWGLGNEDDETSFDDVTSTAGQFGFGDSFPFTLSVEPFELVYSPRQFTVNPSTNVISAPSHGLSDGAEVWFTVGSDGQALPGGITNADPYYLDNATAHTFELLDAGANAVDVLSVPIGPVYFVRAPSGWWHETLTL